MYHGTLIYPYMGHIPLYRGLEGHTGVIGGGWHPIWYPWVAIPWYDPLYPLMGGGDPPMVPYEGIPCTIQYHVPPLIHTYMHIHHPTEYMVYPSYHGMYPHVCVCGCVYVHGMCVCRVHGTLCTW